MRNALAEDIEAETSRYVDAGPIRVHYNDIGTGDPLIFLEGQGAGTSAWVVYRRVVPLLAPHFRCLLPKRLRSIIRSPRRVSRRCAA